MTDPSSINEQQAMSSLKDQTSEPVEDKNISSVNNKVDKLKSNPFVSSLKDRMTQLDTYITKIWNTFTKMVSTINQYIKYFIRVTFKTAKYILTFFTFIFILIMLFSKARKENLYVLLYFFIAFTMMGLFGAIISMIIFQIEIIIDIVNTSKKISNPERSLESKGWLGLWIALCILMFIFGLVALVIASIGLSFLYSAEIELFDIIEVIFKNLMN
jgi:predicted PurR-regulated permease PerM